MVMPMDELNRRLRRIRLFCMDVDGVLTNGCMYYGVQGEALKRFNAHDGMGITILQRDLGIIPVIITQETTEIVCARAAKLKIPYCYRGVLDKGIILDPLLQEIKATYDDVLYVGDDINDLPLLRKAGIAVSVADGMPSVQREVHYVTKARGGDGAIRELVEMIIEARTQHG